MKKTLLNTKYQHLLLSGITAAMLSACGGGVSSYSDNTYMSSNGELIELGQVNPVCQDGSATQEGKVIDANTKQGVAGVEVEIAGCKVTTDKNGYYKFTNIPVAKRVSVNLDKENYISNSEIITIDEDTSNYLEASLDKKFYKWSYPSDEGSVGRNLEIAEDVSYIKEDGSSYTGEVKINYTYKDTTTAIGKESFPGTFEGLNSNGVIVPFVNYKYMVLKLTDDNGNKLEISKPVTINIYGLKGTSDMEIPLWYYHEDKGIWIEKGVAIRDEKGIYKCEITQTGTWSINKPVEVPMATYKGQIVDKDLNPMPNVRVKVEGKNWVSEDLTTDENGEFEVSVVPNEEFKLSAYNYEEKFGAQYTDTLESLDPGETVVEE